MNDNIIMDVGEGKKNINKLVMLSENESSNFSSINAKLRKLDTDYSGFYDNLLNQKVSSITKKFKNLKNVHSDDVFVIRQNVKIYENLARDTANKFKKSGG